MAVAHRSGPWLAAVLFVAAAMAITLVTPPGRDQGLFCYTGWRLLDGDALYLQVWDHKPPGIHLAYALALAVGGKSYLSVVWLSLLVRLGTAWFLARSLVRLGAGRHAPLALLTAFSLAVLPFDGRFWDLAQPEAFMNFWIAASLWLGLRRRLWWAGAALALACWLKPVAIVWAPLLWAVGAGFFDANLTPAVRKGRYVMAVRQNLFGAAAASLPWVIWLAATGALTEFWRAVVVFNSFHATSEIGSDLWHRLAVFGRECWLPVVLAGLWPLTRRWENRGNRAGVFFACWLAAAAAAIGVQQKFFGYHLILLVPPLVGLSVVTVGCGWRGLLRGRPRLLRAGAIVAGWVLVAVWYQPLFQHHLGRPALRTMGRLAPQAFENAFVDGNDFSYGADRDFARQLELATEAGDAVQIMGFEPLVNFLARRPAASRFSFDYPVNFLATMPAAVNWRDQARRQLQADLRRRPPRILAIMMRDANAIEKESSAVQMQQIPWFVDLVSADYEAVGPTEDFIVFRRRGQGRAVAE